MRPFTDLKIVFFGTPGFAVGSLKTLMEAGCNVVAVVTAPDKPSGRGLQMQSAAVKTFAEGAKILVLQPPKLKDPQFLKDLKNLGADLHIIVAFRMLPVAVWDMPPLGTVNVHASLLPQYRGAAPINWAIINGEKETGVTTFRLKHEIDTGDILLQERILIEAVDNAGTLHDKLMEAGAALLVKTVQKLADGSISEQPQQSLGMDELKHAPKLFKEHMLINWTKPVQEIMNLIRGLSPYPAAFTRFQGKVLKIYEARTETADIPKEAGSYDTDGKAFLRFAAANGWIYVDELQQEGKKRMQTADFLRGFRG
jgi:methionyl-tRNA formyltransferase